VDAQLLSRQGKVFLRKNCLEHGFTRALVSEDIDWYVNGHRFNKPGANPRRYATAVKKGCPQDCGLCPEHRQHTCLAVLEITSDCNLNCPTCFADAGGFGFDLSVPQVKSMIDSLVTSEGQVEIVQISGGEPTLHPQLLQILDVVQDAGISQIMLNTNGLLLAEDTALTAELAKVRPVIYLQFDGFKESTYQALRGRSDLLAVKELALEKVYQAGMVAVLVTTLVEGINDDEIGHILGFGLKHPAVVGVSFQPATFTGRSPAYDTMSRITVPGVLRQIETQTGGLFTENDFFPVPCPHPACSACTYAFVDGDIVLPLPRLVPVEDYLDYLTNRTMPDVFDVKVQKALENLWSMRAIAGSQATEEAFRCAACRLDCSPGVKDLERYVFMVNIHGFMDKYNFDLARCMKCCIHELVPDGRLIPFCVYNNCGYRERIKTKLSGIAKE
jgi:uncharacterized radical SAM superfamily Fe-S cluster-containing enzyme